MKTIFFVCIFFTIGILFCAIQYEYIIIRKSLTLTKKQSDFPISTQKSLIFYHQNNTPYCETVRIEWPEQDKARIAFNITSTFFETLLHEHIITHRIAVQSSFHDTYTNTIYLSLDRTPFKNEWSIHKKWLLIEDLLTTFKKNNMPFSFIQLLINHQPLVDPHLDFSRAWPIQGFMV